MALLLIEDELVIDLLLTQTLPKEVGLTVALEKAVGAERVWARYFVSQSIACAEEVKKRVTAEHANLISAVLAHCAAAEVGKWLEVFEEADSQRRLKEAVLELLPSLAPSLPAIMSCSHSPAELEPILRENANVGNYKLLLMLQERFQLLPSASQLPYWCLCNLLRPFRIPPYLSKARTATELQTLVQALAPAEQLKLLNQVCSNRLPLQLQEELLTALVRAGCQAAESTAALVEQKVAFFALLEGIEAQRQVFECLSAATLVQTLLDFLQEGETIRWGALFQSPQLFSVARDALVQTVQIALNREPMDTALAAFEALLQITLPPTALAEIYGCSLSRLTQEKDTMFAARLGRLLERSLSEFMTVGDRQLVASLNTAVAIEICELCMQGKVDLATARCAMYEGASSASDVEVLRSFLEARAGLPFAREALEKLGAEKGWRSYLKLFGR